MKTIAVTDNRLQQFWGRVDRRAPDECWPWTGNVSSRGYGVFFDGRQTLIASRVAWFLANGLAQPPGMVCHSCDNPICVNPAHLWIGTQGDNIRDCVEKRRHANSRKTHCSRGHLFNQENTYWYDGRFRQCRACDRDKKIKRSATREREAGNRLPSE